MSDSTVFFGPVSAEEINRTQIPPGQMSSHLGIELVETGSDYMVARMPVDHRTIQRIGILNGGASLALAETLGSIAASYCVDRDLYYIVGQEINANHIRPVRSGFVYATATPIHLGRTSQVWNITIRNEEGKLTCISRFTVAVLKKNFRAG